MAGMLPVQVASSLQCSAHTLRIVVCCALLQVLGRGLAQLPRDQIVVATKVGRYGANTFDFR